MERRKVTDLIGLSLYGSWIRKEIFRLVFFKSLSVRDLDKEGKLKKNIFLRLCVSLIKKESYSLVCFQSVCVFLKKRKNYIFNCFKSVFVLE